MDDSLRNGLRFVASQLVFVVGLIHVGVGVGEWLEYGRFGIFVPPELLWAPLLLSGLAVLAGMVVAHRSERRRPFYLAGALVMVAYVVAYFGWHLGGHRSLLVVGTPSPHDLSLQFVIDHYFAGLLETVSLTLELIAAVLLAVLYVDADE